MKMLIACITAMMISNAFGFTSEISDEELKRDRICSATGLQCEPADMIVIKYKVTGISEVSETSVNHTIEYFHSVLNNVKIEFLHNNKWILLK